MDLIFPSVPKGIHNTPKVQYADIIEAMLKSELQWNIKSSDITKLGKGSYGVVYQINYINSENIKESAVLKKIDNTISDIDESLNEIKVLKYLKDECSNYILCYIDSLTLGNYTYIITESLGNYITLFEYVKIINTQNIIDIVTNLITGLQHIHNKGVVHRDVKLENIMIDTTTLQIKYIDFGMACLKNDFKCNQIIERGTYIYNPPEYFWETTSSFENNIEGDIWSLGLSIFKLISKSHLYKLIVQRVYLQDLNNLRYNEIINENITNFFIYNDDDVISFIIELFIDNNITNRTLQKLLKNMISINNRTMYIPKLNFY